MAAELAKLMPRAPSVVMSKRETKWLEFKKKWKTVMAFDRNTEWLHRKNKTTFYLLLKAAAGYASTR